MAEPMRRRVFFALWPDHETRRELVRATRSAVRRSGGRATAEANLHATLAFLGPVTAPLLRRVQEALPPGSPGFELVLDRLGFWAGSRVLWASPSRVPPPLTALESNLWDRLVELGFERERRAYRPHVTLARKAQAVEAGIQPVHWQVTGLALVESVPGARHPVYEVLQAWPFR